MAGHSVDEYLETIYFLAFPIGEYRPATESAAIASRVADMLGVSRASAGEMLKRLEADGSRRAWRAEGGDPHRDRYRAREARRAQAPDHRALPDRLHGVHGERVSCARGRARRHVHGRDDRADQRAARLSRPLPARLAGRARRRAGRERRARVARRPRAGPDGRDRAARRARRRAAPLVLRRGVHTGDVGRDARGAARSGTAQGAAVR